MEYGTCPEIQQRPAIKALPGNYSYNLCDIPQILNPMFQ